jgi:hypothetical protein
LHSKPTISLSERANYLSTRRMPKLNSLQTSSKSGKTDQEEQCLI